MSFQKPPSWRQEARQGSLLCSFGAGGYQAARPGANQPDGIPRNAPTAQTAERTAPPQSAQTRNSFNTQPVRPTQAAIVSDPTKDQNTFAQRNNNVNHQEQIIRFKNDSSTASGVVTEYISQKIYNIHTTNKVIDFVSKLTKAKLCDFANIHGRGGSKHAPNSTIGLTICDSTRGTGDASVTVKYAVDVEDMSMLYEAAMDARLGRLKPDNSAMQEEWLNAIDHLLGSWRQIAPLADGSRPIPRQSLNALDGIIRNAKGTMKKITSEPVFVYTREKNNPYKIENGYGPVSKITICYSPVRRDGQPSSYPWYISIENFNAPITKKAGGATTHNSAQAINKRSAFINLSADDFTCAMVAVNRFVRLWEQVNMGPVMAEAYHQIECARAQNTEGTAVSKNAPASEKTEHNERNEQTWK